MEQATFKKGIGILFECFPHKSINMDIAWDLLKDLDDRRFMVAIRDICSATVDLYPNTNIIALLREITLSGKSLLSGEAWAEVMKEVSRVGSWGEPVFKEDTTRKAVEAIGWKAICQSENIGIERAHFLKVYDALEKREHKESVRLPEVKALLNKKPEIPEAQRQENMRMLAELKNKIGAK